LIDVTIKGVGPDRAVFEWLDEYRLFVPHISNGNALFFSMDRRVHALFKESSSLSAPWPFGGEAEDVLAIVCLAVLVLACALLVRHY
jgi:hypothetical protein